MSVERKVSISQIYFRRCTYPSRLNITRKIVTYFTYTLFFVHTGCYCIDIYVVDTFFF